MIILAISTGVLYVTLLIELFRLQDRHTKAETAWLEERRELLNRIQAPERIPVQASQDYVIPEREQDEWASVGTIVIDPDYGTKDDDDGG
jgi:23S rRNA A2030 N6-methylase RlmJ